MPRDYAKYKPKQPKKRAVDQSWRTRLLLLLVLFFAVSIVIFGVYLYKNAAPDLSLKEKTTAWLAQLKTHLSHKKADLSAKGPVKQQAKEEPEVRFNFYTELPQMQVTLPETEDAPSAQVAKHPLITAQTQADTQNSEQAPKMPAKTETAAAAQQPPAADNKPQYIVQVGLFKNETAAGQTRVSLLLSGFEVDTVTTTDDSTHATLYRLQKGPFASINQAKAVQKQLQKKGVTGVVKQL